jgi:hypothetical protein
MLTYPVPTLISLVVVVTAVFLRERLRSQRRQRAAAGREPRAAATA